MIIPPTRQTKMEVCPPPICLASGAKQMGGDRPLHPPLFLLAYEWRGGGVPSLGLNKWGMGSFAHPINRDKQRCLQTRP